MREFPFLSSGHATPSAFGTLLALALTPKCRAGAFCRRDTLTSRKVVPCQRVPYTRFLSASGLQVADAPKRFDDEA